MKKKVISIILIGMMVHSVYACGSIAPKEADHDEVNEPVQEESSETVQEKEIPEETEDTLFNSEVQQATDGENAEPIYVIEPGLTQDDTYEMQDWQAAYAKYAEELEAEYQNDKWLNDIDITYSLIYVDEDSSKSSAASTSLCSRECPRRSSNGLIPAPCAPTTSVS